MTNFWTTVNGKITGYKSIEGKLDFPIDFSQWLSSMNDTYISHQITKTGSIVIESSFESSGVIVPIISGGKLNELCSFTVIITTTGGLRDGRTFYLRIIKR